MGFMCQPLSVITGEICPNYTRCRRPCVLACERGNDISSNQTMPNINQQSLSNKKCLVIGGGPAGMAVAWTLCTCDCEVTIWEKENLLGGELWLIPDFRLEKRHITYTISKLIDAGINIETNKSVDLHDLQKYAADFHHIFIATGANKPRKLGILGEEFDIVEYAVPYLKGDTRAKNVVVIGGGDVAVDCGLEAISRGGNVTICYRKTQEFMSACNHEIERAITAGVKFDFELVPYQINENGVTFKRNNQEILYKCDKIVIAVGQIIDLPDTVHNLDNVHVVGDAATGASSVARAAQNAKAMIAKLISR